jgi:hypothetical protein
MTTIIAGEFATMDESEAAAGALKSANFEPADVSVFMLNSPGQHALYPVGGDEDADPGAKKAHTGAVTGAVIGATVGLGAGAAAIVATDVGVAVAATAAAVGAYTGSLVGALNKTGDDESHEPAGETRHAGAMVAVNTPGEEAQQRAADILRSHGAKQVERAEGRWEDGKWLDFDPRVTPDLIFESRPTDPSRRSAPGASS